MKHRKAFKSKEFLEKSAVKKMQEEHKKAFGTPINDLGYPDMGNGRYAAELDYPQWVEFNNAQRAHYNMIEISAPVLSCLTLSGLFQPAIAAGLGFTFGVGRIVYSMGYQSNAGANGRLAGAVIASIATYSLYLLTIYNGVKMTGLLKF